MPKPDYLSLFSQLEVETDPVQRQALLDQLYNFAPPVPLPEGETVEDYLLSDEEIEKFGYVDDDYVQPNPGTEYAEVDALFVLPNYVTEGYINIQNNAISPYYVEGYADEDFVVLGGSVGGYIAYVGKYYNDLGEST